MTDSDFTLNDWRRRLDGGGAVHYLQVALISFCDVYTCENCEFGKRQFSGIFAFAAEILSFQNGNSQ